MGTRCLWGRATRVASIMSCSAQEYGVPSSSIEDTRLRRCAIPTMTVDTVRLAYLHTHLCQCPIIAGQRFGEHVSQDSQNPKEVLLSSSVQVSEPIARICPSSRCVPRCRRTPMHQFWIHGERQISLGSFACSAPILSTTRG
jgi:hypothetical protein